MQKKEGHATHWRAVEMLVLQQIIQNVGKGDGNPDAAIKTMLQLMSELLGLNLGRLVLQNKHDQQLQIYYAYGLTPEQITRGVYQPGEGITGAVFSNGYSLVVTDVGADEAFIGRAIPLNELPQEKFSFIALPVMANHRCVGVLACHRLESSERTQQEDMAILRILAALIGQLLHLQESTEERTQGLQAHNAMLKKSLSNSRRYGIIGSSNALLRAINELEQVTNSNANVLLLGESGTGKEMFARALHTASHRADKPFIKVDCSAIPESLFEAELFGQEKTASAEARLGFFEQANGGTLFLDEISALPLAVQNKFMLTLQDGTITRVGGRKPVKVDVRIVTATCNNLAEEVQHGRFRQDLYYRLYVIPVQLPPLRDRREDIPELAAYFLNRINQQQQRSVNLTPEAVTQLKHYSWPGNIRQLESVLEHLVEHTPGALADEEAVLAALGGADVPTTLLSSLPDTPTLHTQSYVSPPIRPYLQAESHTLNELEQALQLCRGNKTQAAQMLGLSTRQFYYRLKKLKKG